MREEERRRIARELHDELGQLLTGVKLDFSTVIRRLREVRATGDVVDRLQSAIGQIDIAIAMVRRIATDLRPAALDHRDLGGAIEDEARRVAAQAGVSIRVSNHLTANVEPELATVAFRIFQEALTNAVRHAQPTSISARVALLERGLLVCLRDDGCGMKMDLIHAPDSLGMLGMRERARTVNGKLRIRSRLGRGTMVLLFVPAKPA
jgi:signal transduction histidine kinase